MLELPPELSKNFGLGPRGFSQKTGPKAGQDKSWTQAPNAHSNVIFWIENMFVFHHYTSKIIFFSPRTKNLRIHHLIR